eukprot:Opistho-2@67389
MMSITYKCPRRLCVLTPRSRELPHVVFALIGLYSIAIGCVLFQTQGADGQQLFRQFMNVTNWPTNWAAGDFDGDTFTWNLTGSSARSYFTTTTAILNPRNVIVMEPALVPRDSMFQLTIVMATDTDALIPSQVSFKEQVSMFASSNSVNASAQTADSVSVLGQAFHKIRLVGRGSRTITMSVDPECYMKRGDTAVNLIASFQHLNIPPATRNLRNGWVQVNTITATLVDKVIVGNWSAVECFMTPSASLPSGWIAVDKDGDSSTWTVDVTSGRAVSYSYADTTQLLGYFIDGDNWLISPLIVVEGAGTRIRFNLQSDSDASFPDTVEVLVSPSGGTTPAAFTRTLSNNTVGITGWSTGQTVPSFESRIPDDLVGQSVRIAFRHRTSVDGLAVYVDNVKVGTRFWCRPNPCKNNGTCVDGADSASCTCLAGFSGVTCDTNIDDCTPNPCRNGGICADLVNGYTCTCPKGYSDTNCSTANSPLATRDLLHAVGRNDFSAMGVGQNRTFSTSTPAAFWEHSVAYLSAQSLPQYALRSLVMCTGIRTFGEP